MLRSVIATSILLSLLGAEVSAESTLPVDLARLSPGVTNTETVAPGTYRVVIKNKVPGKAYELTFAREIVEIPPIEITGLFAEALPTYDCENPLGSLREFFQGVTQERQVRDTLARLRAAAVQQRCTQAQLDRLEQVIDQETRVERTYALDAGERITVTVERTEGDAATTWTSVFTTGPRGEWNTLYGFTFLRSEDEEYSTRAREGEEGQFDILRATDNQDLDFAPSIFFQWQSAKRANKTWSYGPVAGLGFDLDTPVVFGGYGATFNRNVMFTAGIVIHEQQRLDGRFSLDRPIGENLNSDQLTEPTYDVNVYFGVALRLGSNPFSRGGGEDDGAPQEAQPADGDGDGDGNGDGGGS